jgi:hypothetical protein
LNEEENSLIERFFISGILVMDDFNCSVSDRQVHKDCLFHVRKTGTLRAAIVQITEAVRLNVVKQKRINIGKFVKSIIWKF